MKLSYFVFIIFSCNLVIAKKFNSSEESIEHLLTEEFYIELFLLMYGRTELMENCTILECYFDVYENMENSSFLKRSTTTASPPSSTTNKVKIVNVALQEKYSRQYGKSQEEFNFLTSGNWSYFDFSQCGSYPGCKIEKMYNGEYRITCNKTLVQVIVSFEGILFLIVILSNIIIIYVTLQTKALCEPHGYFKLSLAFSDLIAGFFVLPPILHNSLNKINYNVTSSNVTELVQIIIMDEIDTSSAIAFGVMGILSSVSAIYSLLLLSIDSFLSILRPLEYRAGSVMTSKLAIGLLILVWMFSFFICLLPIMAKELFSYGMSRYTLQYIPFVYASPVDAEDKPTLNRYIQALLYAILVWGLPFVTSWILTLATAYMSWTMLENMKRFRMGNQTTQRKMNHDMVKTVIIVLSLFTITALPVIAFIIVSIQIPVGTCQNNAIATTFFVCSNLLIFGRFLNVIVYNVMNKDFKDACRKLLINIKRYFKLRNEIDRSISKKTLSCKISSSTSSSSKKYRKSLSVHSFCRRVQNPTQNCFVEKKPTKRSVSLPDRRPIIRIVSPESKKIIERTISTKNI